MITYKIKQRISSLEELYATPEYQEIFKGYENEIPRRQQVDKHFKFIEGFITECGSVFKHYQCEDGLQCCREIELISVLSSAPMQTVKITESEIKIFNELTFPKGRSKVREQIIKHKIIVA